MKASDAKTKKRLIITSLSVVSLMLPLSSALGAEESVVREGSGVKNAQTQTKTARPSKKGSEIANGDLGSGRIKAGTAKSAKKASEIANGDLGSGRIKAEKIKPH